MKNQKGITLIALVITIIVMLILVAVTLTIALGEDGILGKARQAKEDTETMQGKEDELMSSDFANKIDNTVNGDDFNFTTSTAND